MKILETETYYNGTATDCIVNDIHCRFSTFTDEYNKIRTIRFYILGTQTTISYQYKLLSKYTEEEWFQYSLLDEWLLYVKQFIEEVL